MSRNDRTGNGRKAGPAQAGPARERVVIRDKRKIDSSGQAKDAAASAPAAEDAPEEPAAAGTGATGATGPGADGAKAATATTTVDPVAGTAQAGAPESAGTASPDSEPAQDAPDQAAAAKPGTGPAEATVTDAPPAPAESATSTVADPPGVSATVDLDSPVDLPAAISAELDLLRSQVNEHLADLQRVTAEYANYRRRVDRDRSSVSEHATGAVLTALLPVLDDLDRAREHGDLVGPFGAVAEALNANLAKFGLMAFGDAGDPFDPTRHEAVAHETSGDVSEATCVTVMRRGYLLGDRLLRPALVAVADPE